MRGIQVVLLGLLLPCLGWAQPAVAVVVFKSGEEIRGVRWGVAGPRAADPHGCGPTNRPWPKGWKRNRPTARPRSAPIWCAA